MRLLTCEIEGCKGIVEFDEDLKKFRCNECGALYEDK